MLEIRNLTHVYPDGTKKYLIMSETCRIEEARGGLDDEAIRSLYFEYLEEFSSELMTQNFDVEIRNLPGEYVPPLGKLLLAWRKDGELIGCIGLRALDFPSSCELKRLFVRQVARGCGSGRALAEAAIEAARVAGYHRIMLETLPSMTAAIATYEALGFQPIPPYWNNIIPDVVFLGKDLKES